MIMATENNRADSWLCLQIGRREHYAIPRCLHANGQLRSLITDAWQPSPALRPFLPAALRLRLDERSHPDLMNAPVTAFTWNWLVRESLLKLTRRSSGWDDIVRRNEWFQRRCARAFERSHAASGPGVLFAYSYAARLPFERAKARGWRTVLGQIDPGPRHDEIVAAATGKPSEAQNAPPPEYWRNWHLECALADCIVVNSEWSASCLKEAGIDTGKITVIPLAFESERLGNSKSYPTEFTDQRPLRVLYAGKLAAGKGVCALLDAMRPLSKEPVTLTLAGPIIEVESGNWRELPNVSWAGEISGRGMSELYDRHDVFVFPTFSDGYGLTQLEAQARRLPVIASRFCGDVVKHRENGWLVHAVTGPEIATALRHCVNHPTELSMWSQHSALPRTSSLKSIRERLNGLFAEPMLHHSSGQS